MNIKHKIITVIVIIVAALSTNFKILINNVKAANLNEISQIELHSKGLCGQLLKYKGVIVKTTYVEYTYNGNNYPAYCLDKTLPGITEELVYSVGTNKKVEDIGLWRTIINGYPYKSISELGVANEDEAFTATKHAIYCYLFENNPSDYEAIGEAGQRTLNALNKIVSDAENSKETQAVNTAAVKSENEEWIEDEENSKYVYKTYSVSSAVSYLSYEIQFEDMPQGSKITNINGTETNRFSEGEKFRIMLLKESLNDDGEITLNMKTAVKTKPVIYGASPNSSWQNYALTGYMYEDESIKFSDKYYKIEKPRIPKKPVIPEKEEKKNYERILPVTGM